MPFLTNLVQKSFFNATESPRQSLSLRTFLPEPVLLPRVRGSQRGLFPHRAREAVASQVGWGVGGGGWRLLQGRGDIGGHSRSVAPAGLEILVGRLWLSVGPPAVPGGAWPGGCSPEAPSAAPGAGPPGCTLADLRAQRISLGNGSQGNGMRMLQAGPGILL